MPNNVWFLPLFGLSMSWLILQFGILALPAQARAIDFGELEAREDRLISTENLFSDLWEAGRGKEIILAAEFSGRMRDEAIARFRVEDEEDLHWKPLLPEDMLYRGQISPLASASSRVNKGVEYAEQGRFDQAAAEFTKSIQVMPSYGLAYFNRGTAYSRQGQADLAIADLDKAIELGKAYPANLVNAYHNRGIAFIQKGRHEQALADFNQILKLKAEEAGSDKHLTKIRTPSYHTPQTNPQDADVSYMRGVVELKKGQIDAALADFGKAVELDPKFAKAYGNRGVAYAMQGQLDRALADLNKALELNPKYGKARYMRGQVYALQKKNDQALKINAKNDQALYYRGILYYGLGRTDQALADFNQVLQLNPKPSEARNNRGGLLSAKSQYDQAIIDFNRAIAQNPRYANAYYNRGVAFYNKSLYDKALADFNKSLELDSKLADAYFSKALTLEAAGRQGEAREAYAAFVKVAPPEARQQIEEAKGKLGRR